jgi:hypothetical protein
MTRKDLVNNYKSENHIRESYKLTIGENYLIDKLLKALTIPVVVGQSEQFYCVSSSALVYGKPCSGWCGDENCKTLYKQ